MSNEKYNAAAAGLTLAAIDGAQMMIESLRKDRESLSNVLAAARLEIASLQGRVSECGAGAGCCAQAARIEELEAQLEAVGAGGVGPLVRALEIAEAALADIGDADREPGDDVAWCEARAAQALPEVRAVLITAAHQPAAQAGWCGGCSPDNCGGCMTSAAPAQAAPVDAQHSTACLYHYALSRLGLRDSTGLRVLFWDAHNSLSWDSKTDWYVTPDADRADCGQCNAARAAQGGTND